MMIAHAREIKDGEESEAAWNQNAATTGVTRSLPGRILSRNREIN